MKSVQENFSDCAVIIFNVKGKDLPAFHKLNDEPCAQLYKALNLGSAPFENVRCFAPHCSDDKKGMSYLPQADVEKYFADGLLKKFVYVYEDDRARHFVTVVNN